MTVTCERCGGELAGVPVTLCDDCETNLSSSASVQWALNILESELQGPPIRRDSIEHAADLLRDVLGLGTKDPK